MAEKSVLNKKLLNTIWYLYKNVFTLLMQKKLYPFLIFMLFCITTTYSQHPEANRANIWYFGNGAGITFSSGSPVAITD